jgi:hypothetical protein
MKQGYTSFRRRSSENTTAAGLSVKRSYVKHMMPPKSNVQKTCEPCTTSVSECSKKEEQ